MVHPLIGEAMKKAAVGWLAVGDRPATAAWLTWIDGAAYVVHGGPEQPVPGLADAGSPGPGSAGGGSGGAGEITVSVRGESGGRIVSWRAASERVEPGSPTWDEVAPQLAQKRLNASDPVGAPVRWAAEATITRLTPLGDPSDSLPDDSGAAPPRPTSATTPVPIPRTLHRRR